MKSMQYRNMAAELAALDAKVSAFLPPRYQHCYTSVSPNSMGSAGLRYGPDGQGRLGPDLDDILRPGPGRGAAASGQASGAGVRGGSGG